MTTEGITGATFAVTSSGPALIDPGAQGWPEEPKVSAAERQLFGSLAGVVRLLGQMAVAAEDAYRIACRRQQEEVVCAPSTENSFYEVAIMDLWNLYRQAARIHRSIAERAVGLQSKYGEIHGQMVDGTGDVGEAADEKIRSQNP